MKQRQVVSQPVSILIKVTAKFIKLAFIYQGCFEWQASLKELTKISSFVYYNNLSCLIIPGKGSYLLALGENALYFTSSSLGKTRWNFDKLTFNF